MSSWMFTTSCCSNIVYCIQYIPWYNSLDVHLNNIVISSHWYTLKKSKSIILLFSKLYYVLLKLWFQYKEDGYYPGDLYYKSQQQQVQYDNINEAIQRLEYSMYILIYIWYALMWLQHIIMTILGWLHIVSIFLLDNFWCLLVPSCAPIRNFLTV